MFVAITAFLVSLIGTRLLILAFRNRRLMLDIPNSRSNHNTAVPKGGGLAVMIALIIPMLVANVEFVIVLSIFLLAAVSLLDDLIGVNPLIRLLVQILSVAMPLSMMSIDFMGPEISPIVEKIVIGALWVWCINLFNFMDGIDGISAMEMISIGLGITFVTVFAEQFPNDLGHYGMIFAAAGCGFWWWNRHPAKIFLGDVGSIPIGFLMGYLLLMLAISGYGIAALILPGYYLADGSITLLKRLWKREKIWQAHSGHYYQKAVRKGWTHSVVVRYVAGVNILLGFLAVYTVLTPELEILYLALASMAVCMLLGFFGHEHTHPPTVFPA